MDSLIDDWIDQNFSPPGDKDGIRISLVYLDPIFFQLESRADLDFLLGMQWAAFGHMELLARFISDDEYFASLTPSRRNAIAWLMKNKLIKSNPKTKSLKTAFKLASVIRSAAIHHTESGISKTQAIRKGAYDWLQLDSPDDDPEDLLESLESQVFRELGKHGMLSRFFENLCEAVTASVTNKS